MQIKDAIVTDHPFSQRFLAGVAAVGSRLRVPAHRRRRHDLPGPGRRHRGERARLWTRRPGRRRRRADAQAGARIQSVHHRPGAGACRQAHRRPLRGRAVHEQRRGGERVRAEVRTHVRPSRGRERRAPQDPGIHGGFHGRTYGALACTPYPKYQEPFRPMLPGVEVAPYTTSPRWRATLDGSFAGVIVEVVQGEGGLGAMTPGVRGGAQRMLRRARPHPDRRRGADRPGTLRPRVRLRQRRPQAAHHHAGQAAGRRPAAFGGVAAGVGQRPASLRRARHPFAAGR